MQFLIKIKKYQGNIRLSYSDTSGDNIVTNNEIINETNYYPFGLTHEGYNVDVATSYKYKYNGKELQDDDGLNVTAMDFRNYDNALGRFNVIDPLAEMDYSSTPYHFTNNNPVLFSDPSGLQRQSGQTAGVYYDWDESRYRSDSGSSYSVDDAIYQRDEYGGSMFRPYNVFVNLGGGGGGGGGGNGTGSLDPQLAGIILPEITLGRDSST